MADSVYLSLWVRGFSEQTMLAAWAVALAEFPVSSLAPGIRELSVYPFHWAEAPVLERSFEEGADLGGSQDGPFQPQPAALPAAKHAADVAHVVALASEFLHDDYAYEAELNWDVWVSQDGTAPGAPDQWERRPQVVPVSCLGPKFESEEADERSDLLINFGLDSLLLPEDPDALGEALEGVAGSCYQDNIAQLLGYIHRLEAKLPLTRRQLWSTSGEDLASRIRSAWG